MVGPRKSKSKLAVKARAEREREREIAESMAHSQWPGLLHTIYTQIDGLCQVACVDNTNQEEEKEKNNLFRNLFKLFYRKICSYYLYWRNDCNYDRCLLDVHFTVSHTLILKREIYSRSIIERDTTNYISFYITNENNNKI